MARVLPTVEASKHPLMRNGADPMDIDTHLLDEVGKVAAGAGDRLLAVYSPDARPADREEVTKAALRNEEVSSRGLRDALHALRPQARWLEEEQPDIVGRPRPEHQAFGLQRRTHNVEGRTVRNVEPSGFRPRRSGVMRRR